jgi:hypothetical protein
LAVTSLDILEILLGDRLPVSKATSKHLAMLYPFMTECGLIDPRTGEKVPGIPIGNCGINESGGLIFFDEYELYQRGLITNSNVIVLGKLRSAKSGSIKQQIHRGAAMGFCYLVTDRKGEYGPLAKAIPGSKIIRFGEGSNVFINPLGRDFGEDVQNELLIAMTRIGLGRKNADLSVIEKSLLWQANADVHSRHTRGDLDPVLPELVDVLFNPTPGIVEGMHRSIEEVKDQGYEIGLALQRYTEKDLKGMFHQQTTPNLFTDETPLLVLDCQNVKGDAAVVVIMLINFFTQSQWARNNSLHRIHKIFHDEAWDLAAYPGFVESVRRSFKLGGTWGVSNYVIAHHLSNFDRSTGGDEAIKDIIADSDTKILFRQDENELRNSALELGVTEAEIQYIIQQQPGQALYKIGELPGIPVTHTLWPEEREFTETRHLLLGQAQPKL